MIDPALENLAALTRPVAGLQPFFIDHVTKQLTAQQTLLDSVERMGGMTHALDRLRDPEKLFGPSLPDVLARRSGLSAAMDAFRTPDETLASLISATRGLDGIRSPDSFAAVGAAGFAAGDLLSRGNLFGDEFSARIDTFFGDWTRINRLPDNYPDDPGVRREVIREIKADGDLPDVDTHEAAAIIRESLKDKDGNPVTVLGLPTGLVMPTDPGKAAFTLLVGLERLVRDKVVTVMREKFGENWVEDKCADFLPDWRKRSEDEVGAGLPPGQIIEYSTLHELGEIITKYWDHGFAIAGRKPRIISRPVSALIPLRNRVCHAREVNSEILFGVIHNVRKLEPWLREGDSTE
ncbi:MAG: hypothetical protein GDA39_08395 [Hyphomonadaceae bacterium]|nr:hypothetical protein [Hyphomonadaceae bacterium]MBC6412875.1 hypothetical protein [Hyphomonadaceae bacterium]